MPIRLHGALVLSLLIGLTSCTSQPGTHRPAPTSQPAVEQAADQAETTVIAPHLDVPIQPGQSILWCATLQIAWDELTDWSGAPILVEGHPETAVKLSAGRFPKAWVGERDIIAEAGTTGDRFVQRILAQLRNRFGESSDASMLDDLRNPGQIGVYAYLQKDLQFRVPFERDEMTFLSLEGTPDEEVGDSPDPDERNRIHAFGFYNDRADDGQKEARARQVSILAFEPEVVDEDHSWIRDPSFVIELHSTSSDDRLILASIQPPPTLRQAIDDVVRRMRTSTTQDVDYAEMGREMEASNDAEISDEELTRRERALYQRWLQSRRLMPMEELSVPILAVDQTRVFEDIVGRSVVSSHSRLSGMPFSDLRQRIHFKLDETGAGLISEAAGSLFGGPPRDFRFRRPFLVLLLRHDSPVPYFAAWIGNTDLMHPVADADE